MKLISIILFVAVAACSALPSTPNVHADIYMNTLLASQARIVGGQPAERRQFRYQVSLYHRGSHVCGGILIGEKIVLTASHCRVSNTVSAFEVKVGMLKHRENHEDEQTRAVESFNVHEKYPGGVAPNDIAVIILSKPVDINDAVKPINLPTENECSALVPAILSGWGYLSSWNPSVPTTLQWIEMPRISNDECADKLKSILGSSDPLDDSMICTGANTGKDESACNGDSGGPLVIGDTVVGCVSWGISPCGYKNAPSVYTNICSHLEFIKRFM